MELQSIWNVPAASLFSYFLFVSSIYLSIPKNSNESDDRFFPRMIDHVSKAASDSSQDREARLIRCFLFNSILFADIFLNSFGKLLLICDMMILHKIQNLKSHWEMIFSMRKNLLHSSDHLLTTPLSLFSYLHFMWCLMSVFVGVKNKLDDESEWHRDPFILYVA